MSIYKILFHSLILAVFNLVSIIAGFSVSKLFSGVNQFLIQIPFALVVTIFLFIFWDYLLKKMKVESLIIRKKSLFYIYTFAFGFSPVLYYIFRLIFSEILRSFGNIPGIWMFQLAGNLFIVFIMIVLEQRDDERIDEYVEKAQEKQKLKKTGKKERKHKKRGSKKAKEKTSETPSPEIIKPKEK
ncbi:hypothetical protein KAJ27_08820 [bacterium]|nr:hypothetical protein [bacterium]